MALSRHDLASIADFCKRTSDEYLARQIEVHEQYITTLERTVQNGAHHIGLHGDLARMRETLALEIAEQNRRGSR